MSSRAAPKTAGRKNTKTAAAPATTPAPVAAPAPAPVPVPDPVAAPAPVAPAPNVGYLYYIYSNFENPATQDFQSTIFP